MLFVRALAAVAWGSCCFRGAWGSFLEPSHEPFVKPFQSGMGVLVVASPVAAPESHPEAPTSRVQRRRPPAESRAESEAPITLIDQVYTAALWR